MQQQRFIFGLGLPSPSVGTVEVFTLKFPATKHPPLATSSQSVSLYASSTTDQQPFTALYLSTNVLPWS